ncbi:MAG: hypothetical protein ACK5YS_02550 [bacterium]
MNKIEISETGNLLVYKKGYTPDFVKKTIEEKKLSGMRIFAHLKEDLLDNLNFLGEFTFLEGLGIATRDEVGYDYYGFLRKLKNLKYLNLQNEGSIEIDLSNLTKLEKLSLQWRDKIVGLEKCAKIESLGLIAFKKEDLSLLSPLINLKRLIIKTSSIRSLNGIESLVNLEYALFGNCRRLESVIAINKIKRLAELEFNLCPKMKDIYELHVESLKYLGLIDCKETASLDFVKNFPALQKIILGSTNVIDGNLRPIAHLKEKFYAPKKHYRV